MIRDILASIGGLMDQGILFFLRPYIERVVEQMDEEWEDQENGDAEEDEDEEEGENESSGMSSCAGCQNQGDCLWELQLYKTAKANKVLKGITVLRFPTPISKMN